MSQNPLNIALVVRVPAGVPENIQEIVRDYQREKKPETDEWLSEVLVKGYMGIYRDDAGKCRQKADELKEKVTKDADVVLSYPGGLFEAKHFEEVEKLKQLEEEAEAAEEKAAWIEGVVDEKEGASKA